jgi:hypothetical protein
MESDAGSSWILQLPELITGPELSSDDYAAKEESLISAIRSSNDTIVQILQPLGHYLTTENDTPRSKAASVLAKVIFLLRSPPPFDPTLNNSSII